jgi:hypothetical protein
VAYGVVYHFWLGDMVSGFFLDRRKRWLAISAGDFYRSVIKTSPNLSLLDLKLRRRSDLSED